MAHLYLFDSPDRFVAGTVGEPGDRTFFLQARSGSRLVSVVLEKVQVAVLAERLGRLLDELAQAGLAEAEEPVALPTDAAPLDEPIVGAFRADTLTLGWDGDRERVLVEARAGLPELDHDHDDEAEVDAEDEPSDVAEVVLEMPETGLSAVAAAFARELSVEVDEDDEDEDDGPDLLRVHLTPLTARAFVTRALAIVSAGRPPCPLCGQPLDPQGHLCPRRNGHFLN
jgi:uncharacterized repeat protein (TIGR03847 family)